MTPTPAPPTPTSLPLPRRDPAPAPAAAARLPAPGAAAGPDLAVAFFSRYAGTTLRTYRLKLDAFARWAGLPLADLPAALAAAALPDAVATVEAYRAHLRDDRGASAATINGHLAALRSLCRFLRRAGALPWTLDAPGEPVVAYRDTRGPGVAAVSALLAAAAAQPDAARAARDVALVRLLFDRGLRRAEIVGLDVAHVERDGAGVPTAVRVRGKGRRDREPLSLPPRTAAALAAWLAARGAAAPSGDPGGPLFVPLDRGAGRPGRGGRPRAAGDRLTGEGVARVLARLARGAGLPGRVRPHGLRHTAITALLDAGAPVRDVQRFSRHADPRTIMRYDDNRDDLGGRLAERLSDAV